jgi:acetolactate decarboxylase
LLQQAEVDMIGFFSTRHKGVFTHHDSNVHMHLITSDKKTMGHLDEVVFNTEAVQLYVSVR